MAIFASFSILNFIFPSPFSSRNFATHSLALVFYYSLFSANKVYRHFNRVWWKFLIKSDDKHRTQQENHKIKKHEISQPAFNFICRQSARSCILFFFFYIHFCGSIMFDSISQFPYQIMYLNWIGETKFEVNFSLSLSQQNANDRK